MTRRRARAAAVAAAVLLGAGGVRAITLYGFSAAGAAVYGDADGNADLAAAERQFARSHVLDPIDPWRGHLGVGLARYGRGDLLGAAAAFAAALAGAPERCDLRFNLAVTLEAQGDRVRAGDSLTGDDEDDGELFDTVDVNRPPPATAWERYTAALAVVDARPCPPRDPDGPGDAGRRLDETRRRIELKLAALEPDEVVRNDDRPKVEDSATARGDSEQIEELESRNEAGAAQREAGRDLDHSGATPDGEANW